MELSGITEYYPVGAILSEDVNTWIRKDSNSGTVYYGYAFNLSADPASAVWRIRREVTTSTVTVVTYATSGRYINIWNNRASLTYN